MITVKEKKCNWKKFQIGIRAFARTTYATIYEDEKENSSTWNEWQKRNGSNGKDKNNNTVFTNQKSNLVLDFLSNI